MVNPIILTQLKKKIVEYEDAIKRNGDTPQGLLWSSAFTQELRFSQLVLDLNLDNKSVLDVGCGFGDILKHLSKLSGSYHYTGVDITPAMISIAKKHHPTNKFFVNDYFSNPPSEKFDIIISSGTLNSDFSNSISYRKDAIKTMYDHANYVVSFNMAGGYPKPKNKPGGRIDYADSLDIVKYCLSLTSKIIVRQHYLPKDFTILMFK